MEKRYSVRVSTIPVDKGEKAVMRILDPGRAPADLDGVGLSTADLDVVRRLLGAGHGVILTAGPTGSGKSTTLFGLSARSTAEARTSSRWKTRSSTASRASTKSRYGHGRVSRFRPPCAPCSGKTRTS